MLKEGINAINQLGAKVRMGLAAITTRYFVEIAWFDGTTAELGDTKVQVATATKYVKLDDKMNLTDFVDRPKDATCFTFFAGLMFIRAWKKAVDDKRAHISLVSVSDAGFVDYLTTGENTGAVETPAQA